MHRPACGINSSSVTNCFHYECDQILFSPWPVTGCPCLSVHLWRAKLFGSHGFLTQLFICKASNSLQASSWSEQCWHKLLFSHGETVLLPHICWTCSLSEWLKILSSCVSMHISSRLSSTKFCSLLLYNRKNKCLFWLLQNKRIQTTFAENNAIKV